MHATLLTLVTGLMALYVVCRVVLPARMRVTATILISLAVFGCAERLWLLWLLTGTMNAFLPRPVLLGTSFLQLLVLTLFLLALFRDAIWLVLWLAQRVGKRFGRMAPTQGGFWRLWRGLSHPVLLTLFAALLTGYGMYEALRVPSVHAVRLTIPGLPVGLEGLRVVQLSDLHIGPVFTRDWLEQVVQRVNTLHPDLLVITGDLVDGSPARLQQEIAALKDLRARYGVYLAVGNHEYYSGLAGWLETFRGMGFPVLLNSYAALDVNGTALILAGIADPVASRYLEHFHSENALLTQTRQPPQRGVDSGENDVFPQNDALKHRVFQKQNALEAAQPLPEQVMAEISRRYGQSTTLMLAHNPVLAERSARAGASAQLSGHTHGGIVLPLTPLVARFNAGYVRGQYTVGTMPLYVSSGTGLWGGLPLRLLVPAELTLLTLTGTQDNK